MKFIEQKRVHIPAKTDFIQRKFLDIQYAPGGERRMLDIYLPNEGEGPFPVIIDIFGGGWYFGQKSSHKLEPALALLRRGFAVVSINYSLSYQQKFPTQVYEIKSAIRFVRKNAEKYQMDPDKIALLGESAGAHYAALCATSSAAGKLNEEGWPYEDVSDEVQAVIAVYCPVDLGMSKELFSVEEQAWGIKTIVEEWGEEDSQEGVLLGGAVKNVPEMVEMANPCNYLNEKCPPFLFLHGTEDYCVPCIGSMWLAAKIMQATSIDNVEYKLIEGNHHDIHDFEKEWIYDLEDDFLKRRLGVR